MMETSEGKGKREMIQANPKCRVLKRELFPGVRKKERTRPLKETLSSLAMLAEIMDRPLLL
jgi:hypothetical protein